VLSGFHRAIARIRAVFQSGDLDRNLDAEIQSHIGLRTEDYVSRGVLPDEAERLARIELGGIAQLREAHREIRSLPFIETFVQDLRYAFRGMRRDAAFTAFAILITGLGIGASSTVFSVVNALLLRPLPFRDSGRLVWIANQEWSTQVEQFQDLREQNRSFTDLAG
jgi:putative ABC transport system permease protein